MKLGVHVSISGGLHLSFDRALEKGCNTLQIFTRNPRSWSSSPLTRNMVSKFKEKAATFMIEPLFVHLPYLSNLASQRDEIYHKSKLMLREEVDRCLKLGIPFLVVHLGSHLGLGKEKGIKRIVVAIESLKRNVKGLTILLENTAGSKNSVGNTFEDIALIVENITCNENIGFCLDTCHAFASGYELRSKASVERTLSCIDQFIGVERMMLIHLNDSKGKLGSNIDRHEHIGIGEIGVEGFKAILSNNTVKNTPLILETPVDSRRRDVDNLKAVRYLASQH